MKKIKPILIVVLMSAFAQLINAQGTYLLRQDQGISLSYSRDFYKVCESFSLHKKNKVWKVTAYLSNNSGRPIKMADSYVSNEIRGSYTGEDRSCMELNGLPTDKAIFSPSGTWWDRDAGSEVLKNNSTITMTYYYVVEEGKDPWDPTWQMGAFRFVEEKKPPEWSDWKTSDCYKGLSYQYQAKELVNLNYQVWYEFRVRSSYKEDVNFVISLRDESGRERFGTKNSIRAGGEMQFTEKMDQNYIRSMSIDKVWFPKDGDKPALCDDQRGNDDRGNEPGKDKLTEEKKIRTPGDWSLGRWNGCYAGISSRVRRRAYDDNIGGYNWDIELKNFYKVPVTFYYQYGETAFTQTPVMLSANGGMFTGIAFSKTADGSEVGIKDLCIDAYACKCFAGCDLVQGEANTACATGDKTEDKKKADDAAAEIANKEENARKDNQQMENQIQIDINAIPAEGKRSQLQNEFNNIKGGNQSEPDKNAQLKSFQARVNAETAAVKANAEQVNRDYEKRTEQITDIREQNKEIKKNQAELSTGYASFLAAIFSLRGRTGEGSRFRNGTSLISIRTGLQFILQPVGYIEYTQGSSYNKSTGSRTPINTKEFVDQSIVTPGLFLTTEIHPYFSNFFSIGFTGSVSFGYWPQANDGNNDITSNFAGNSSSTIVNFNYGTEITFGTKPVKLLGRFHMHSHQITTSGETGYTSENSFYKNEYNTFYVTDQKWKSTWAALGLRFGNYEKSKVFVDLALTRYVPTQVIGLKTVYTTKNLLKNDNLTVPVGAYMQVSKQNGFYFRAEYIKDYIIVDEDLKITYPSTKTFFNFTVGRNFEWFGKPHGKKAGKK